MDKTKPIIDRVVVVEGRSDTANLKRFYQVDTYETGGSSLDDADLDRLKRLQKSRGLIVFTDPDFQGERLRKMIMAQVPDAWHVFLRPDEARPRPRHKGSLGVEHASFQSLEAAFADHLGGEAGETSDVTSSDLVRLGLIMGPDSRRRREFLCQALRIGYTNGKQLLKRFHLFGITVETVDRVMRHYHQ